MPWCSLLPANDIVPSFDVTGAPDVQDETTIQGPVWTWSVLKAQWFNPVTQAYEVSSYYTASFDNGNDSSQPGATVHVTLLRSGTWDITVQAAVHYSQPSSDNTLNTWDGSGPADVTGSATLKALIQVERAGAGPFAGSADVAAGGVASNEHMADVEVLVTNTAGTAVSGAYVDIPTMNGDVGEQTNASFSFPAGAATDDKGKYEADKVFTSSDLSPQSVSLTVGGTSAAISQTWNELADTMTDPNQPGQTSEWLADPDFTYDEQCPITFRMAFDGSVPITGHSVAFSTIGLSGEVWNDLEGPIDVDTGDPTGLYDPVSYSEDQINYAIANPGNDATLDYMLSLINYSSVTAKDNLYKTQQTVTLDPDDPVEDVTFYTTDYSVFDPSPPAS